MQTVRLAAIAIAAGALGCTPALAQTVEQFYKGRTVALICSVEAGNGGDVNARLLARHMGRHLPGNPTIVVRNMPGAGHVLAANYLFNEAPKDGSVFATIGPSIITHQFLDGRGVRYDVGRYDWIGASDHGNQVTLAWATTGIKTFDDLRRRQWLTGATGAGAYSLLYPTLMNNLMGTRLKIATGYRSTRDLDFALERGEIEVRAGESVSSLKLKADWLNGHKVIVLAQSGAERDAAYPDVPRLTELAQSEQARRILELFDVELELGRPFMAPPSLPTDRIAALRQAFDETMRDPAYLADAVKSNIDIHPITATAVTATVGKFSGMPPELIAAAKRAKGETDAK